MLILKQFQNVLKTTINYKGGCNPPEVVRVILVVQIPDLHGSVRSASGEDSASASQHMELINQIKLRSQRTNVGNSKGGCSSVADPDRFGPDPTSENRPDPDSDPDSVKTGSGFI